MTETPKYISLYTLNNRIREGVKELFPDSTWMVAEIAEMNTNQSGHCYLEFVEKNADTDQIVARARATIWSFTFRMLKPYFESVTGQRFTPGIKVLVQVAVEFHEVYGFSLNVKDIEPAYTLGDMARKRQEIIQQLKDEGVFHLNKELEMPLVPQRIAVVSSETAAGYGDFVRQLTENRYGYLFTIELFQSTMQGNEAETSIVNALERIFERETDFDVVVIIRGGGAQADLNCFNSYWLSYNITQFPLPVLTGIGHDRDETIADLVAHTNLKTPTAVAEFIISHTSEFDSYLEELAERTIDLANTTTREWADTLNRMSSRFTSGVNLRMNKESQRLQSLSKLSKQGFKNFLSGNQLRLEALQNRTKNELQYRFANQGQHLIAMQKNILSSLKRRLKQEDAQLTAFESAVQLLDPQRLLKRGYTLTYMDGAIVKNAKSVKPGDILETRWVDGKSISTVDKVEKIN
jgi:exodeoxyribonuclease VII large subunit